MGVQGLLLWELLSRMVVTKYDAKGAIINFERLQTIIDDLDKKLGSIN